MLCPEKRGLWDAGALGIGQVPDLIPSVSHLQFSPGKARHTRPVGLVL